MSSNVGDEQDIRVAWLLPSLRLGFYIQPVFRELSILLSSQMRVFTGEWPGFVPGCEDSFSLQIVGRTLYIKSPKSGISGYGFGFGLPSLAIIPQILNFNPTVIFTNTFTLWTLVAIVLKPWKRWKVIVVYSGSSPNVDNQKLPLRKLMAPQMDAFITNSQAGKAYLVDTLQVQEEKVFARPYQIPDQQALQQVTEDSSQDLLGDLKRPVFLYIGQIVRRKGIPFLLEACSILEQKGYQNYTVIIVGDGIDREEVEGWSRDRGLADRVRWVGWVQYGELGNYFQVADVFVFPTLEDIWGMVVLEAMIFGKPVLCSKWAGAFEMIVEGENGYVFDPHEPEKLADLMSLFIQQPELIETMGKRSQVEITPYTPKSSAQFLSGVVKFVLDN